MAFILHLGYGTSNTAGANVFLFGSKWCIDIGHNLIIAETDSLLLPNCISGNWSSPCRIKETVDEIRHLTRENSVSLKYCYREANKVADKLSSLSHNTDTVKYSSDRSTEYAKSVNSWEYESLSEVRQDGIAGVMIILVQTIVAILVWSPGRTSGHRSRPTIADFGPRKQKSLYIQNQTAFIWYFEHNLSSRAPIEVIFTALFYSQQGTSATQT
ncbi:hypothetical protein RND71_038681 [Anisodus tanguticus]|uniref:RNase H type-1 domain-containing protein n=1 Tax=Anisodus tanguticus TaxID=243964 RepID=A0AAE1UZQ0_9SOLA|nr:hypothetical protein RND71_038681 [Anisodus tanguticus]